MTHLVVPIGNATPMVAETAWIAPSAVLIGDATILGGASVWYGSVLRADLTHIALGENSNLQDNCVVHGDPDYPVTIGASVSIGHGAVIHGCTIEDECLIGMSATVMNGARIGQGSVVAAGAVVLPGTDVPPGSLVTGVPGRVRRPTTEDDRREIVSNARRYVDLASEHALALEASRH